MKKILLSSALILFVGGALAIGGTGAFFSDTELSSGNTFTAGAIDLKIDNHSYYNGMLNASTTWEVSDLTIQKFFDFPDLKPGDVGEDTISLHVDTNDAYLCANVKLTSNDDNGLNDPESKVDNTDGPGNGELANNVNFLMWADDGDNVLESNETPIYQGPIGLLGTGGSITIPLADSATNIWTGVGGPIKGTVTQYIGKAWCFGKIAPEPLVQNGLGTTSPITPANSSGGISCLPTEADGVTPLGNETQTDSLTADITFTAVQSRNNDGFRCAPQDVPTAKLTVTKVVVNLPNSGNKTVSDFNLSVYDGFLSTPVFSGVQIVLPVGTYSINEVGSFGYEASFSGTGCDSEGNVTLGPGDEKSCTITNKERPALITLGKIVTGTAPLAPRTAFRMRVDGVLLQASSSIQVTANHAHTITEDAGGTGNPPVPLNYTFVGITGDSQCPAVLGGTATLTEGQSITCYITNHKN